MAFRICARTCGVGGSSAGFTDEAYRLAALVACSMRALYEWTVSSRAGTGERRPSEPELPRLPPTHDWTAVVLTVRERKSLTQAEFAAALGCSVFSVSKWECGENAPSARHRRALELMATEVGYPVSEWPAAARRVRS